MCCAAFRFSLFPPFDLQNVAQNLKSHQFLSSLKLEIKHVCIVNWDLELFNEMGGMAVAMVFKSFPH